MGNRQNSVEESVQSMKVKYIGEESIAFSGDKVYEVMSVEKGWYRIMTDLDEDYLFPPKVFEIVEEDKTTMRVRYIGTDMVGIRNGKIYSVISVEKGWYRIKAELEEDYLFPPEAFEIVCEEEG